MNDVLLMHRLLNKQTKNAAFSLNFNGMEDFFLIHEPRPVKGKRSPFPSSLSNREEERVMS
jgi:hypothetical protein